jgi:hypothetical protein
MDELCLYILKLLEYCIVELFYIHFACIYAVFFFFFAFIGLFVIIKYENILSLVKIY